MARAHFPRLRVGLVSARPLEQRLKYAFIKTYKPVLDDATFRIFDTMVDYRT